MTRHLMPIEIGAQWFLVEADPVREVLGAEPWLPIPRARAELPGVVVWRGRAVPLVDLGRVLGVEASGDDARARTLIVSHERGPAAFAVSRAREVRSIEDDRLRPIPARAVPYATRELDDDGTLMPVLDLAALLADLEAEAGVEAHAAR